MPGARFFPRARLNYAETLLRMRGEAPAIVFRREDGLRRTWSRDWLYEETSRLAQALAAAGVGEGDRVAAYLPNMPEAVAVMAATAALGAAFSSCSPDFGAEGVLDRFGQIEPRVLFAVDGYKYAGRDRDIRAKLAEIVRRLPSVETVVVIPYLADEPDISAVPGAVPLADFAGGFEPGPIAWNRGPFERPLFILYSSGTTGKPKCIVHGTGGALLTNLKEHRLHADVRDGDRVFYFTTLGWMMWNWLLGRARLRGGADALRRLALPPRAGGALGLRRGGRHHRARPLGQICGRDPQGGRGAGPRAAACRAAHDPHHRLAARAGELRLSSTPG